MYVSSNDKNTKQEEISPSHQKKRTRLAGRVAGVACAVLIVLIFPGYLLLALGQKGITPFQPVLFADNQHALIILLILGIIEVVGIVICWRGAMKRAMSGWVGLALVSITTLLWPFSSMLFVPEVDMARGGFVQSTLTINPGDTITFVNSSDGVKQVLCIGSNQRCSPRDFGTPPELVGGLTLLPGESMSVAFPNNGDYTITSETTPMMNITIHAKASDPATYTGCGGC